MENLKEILATPKQIGLLLGAGVSKACGLPNIQDITKLVIEGITNANFIEMLDEKDTVENILNKTQQLRVLLKSGKEFNSLKESDIIDIEKNIKKVYFPELLSEKSGWLGFEVANTQEYDDAMGSGFALIASKVRRLKRNESNSRGVESVLPYSTAV